MDEQGGDNPAEATGNPEMVKEPGTVTEPLPFPNLILCLMFIVWLAICFSRPTAQTGAERVAQLYYPAQTTLWFSGVEMFAYQGVKPLGEGIKAFLQFDEDSDYEVSAWLGDIFQECITELEHRGNEAGVRQMRMNQAIMHAELGDKRAAQKILAQLEADKNGREFIPFFKAVYAGQAAPTVRFDFTELGEYWMRWQFEAKVARLQGNSQHADFLSNWLRDTEAQQGVRMTAITLLSWTLVLLGMIMVAAYLYKRAWLQNQGAGEHDFPKTVREGLGVFLLTSLVSHFFFLGLSQVPGISWVVWNSYSLVWALTVGAMVWWRFGRHDHAGMLRYFGHGGGPERWQTLFRAGALAFPVAWGALVLPHLLLQMMGADGSHWTEGWYEAQANEPWPGRLVSVINGVVWAPLHEEMLLRGILYAGLRRYFGITVSMLVSASVFGALHYYSLPGFLSVTCFGMVMALLYERTGSWLPGFWAHLLTNLSLGIWQILMLK